MADGFEYTCPAPLTAQGYCLRRETGADQPALQQLYIRQRWHEFAPLMLGETQTRALIAGQYAIQHSQYLSRYENPRFYVLERDGAIAGRLMLGEAQGNLVILDILIDPDRRGTGLGTALISGFLQQAARKVILHVDKQNPARRLYERLGFRIFADVEIAYAMQWDPAAAAAIPASR